MSCKNNFVKICSAVMFVFIILISFFKSVSINSPKSPKPALLINTSMFFVFIVLYNCSQLSGSSKSKAIISNFVCISSFSSSSFVPSLATAIISYPSLLRYIAISLPIPEDGFHRAEFDCECCAKIYMNYIKSEKQFVTK